MAGKGVEIYMKKIICLLFISCLLLSHVTLAKDDATEIVVSGKGVVKAAPDVAYIIIGVERTEKTASDAQKIIAKKMNSILVSLEKIGISKDKIETTNISLYPKYNYNQGKSTLAGYTARNEINVTIDNLDNVGKVIDASINAGATNVNRISFGLKNNAAHKKSALTKAFDAAKEKAQAIAQASSLNLKKIKSILESDAQIIPPPAAFRSMQAAGLGAAAETPITPGNVEVRGNLTVVYECQ